MNIYILLFVVNEEGLLFAHTSPEGEVLTFSTPYEVDEYMGLWRTRSMGKAYLTTACRIATLLDPRAVETNEEELSRSLRYPIELKRLYTHDFAFFGIPLTRELRNLSTGKVITVTRLEDDELTRYLYESSRT